MGFPSPEVRFQRALQTLRRAAKLRERNKRDDDLAKLRERVQRFRNNNREHVRAYDRAYYHAHRAPT